MRSAPCHLGVPRPAGAGTTTGWGATSRGPARRRRRRSRGRQQRQRVSGVRTEGLERIRPPGGPFLPRGGRQDARRRLRRLPRRRSARGTRPCRASAPLPGREVHLAVERGRLVAEQRRDGRLHRGHQRPCRQGLISGRMALGTPNRSRSARPGTRVSRSTSSEPAGVRGFRDVCRALAEVPREPARDVTEEQLTRLGATLQAGIGVEEPRELGRGEGRIELKMVFARIQAASGRRSSASHSSAARWSRRLATGVTACPVALPEDEGLGLVRGDRSLRPGIPLRRRPPPPPPAPRPAACRDRARPCPPPGARSPPDGRRSHVRAAGRRTQHQRVLGTAWSSARMTSEGTLPVYQGEGWRPGCTSRGRSPDQSLSPTDLCVAAGRRRPPSEAVRLVDISQPAGPTARHRRSRRPFARTPAARRRSRPCARLGCPELLWLARRLVVGRSQVLAPCPGVA